MWHSTRLTLVHLFYFTLRGWGGGGGGGGCGKQRGRTEGGVGGIRQLGMGLGGFGRSKCKKVKTLLNFISPAVIQTA